MLLTSRITKLEERLDIITRRKARKRKRIQQGGTMEYGTALARVAAEASAPPKRAKKRRRSDYYELARLGLQRCKIYREARYS